MGYSRSAEATIMSKSVGGGGQGGYKKYQLANKIIDIWKTSFITQCDGDNKKMHIEMYIEIIIVLCIKCAMGYIQTV